MNKKQGNTQRLAVLAVLTAIVIILQAAVVIPLGPFTVTLTMLPIIIGAIMYGPLGGAVLGTVFGVVVSIQVLTGAAGAFSTAMLEYQPAATILICLLKGIAAGLAAGAFSACSGRQAFTSVWSWQLLSHRLLTRGSSVWAALPSSEV